MRGKDAARHGDVQLMQASHHYLAATPRRLRLS